MIREQFLSVPGIMLEKIDEAIKVTLGELNKISQVHPSSEIANSSKENMIGQIYLGLEDSQSVAQYLANRVLLLYNNRPARGVGGRDRKKTAQQLFRSCQ